MDATPARPASKHLLLTLCVGEQYSRLASLTHPMLRAYADRIGADFKVIDKPSISQTTPHWEKFQIFDLLGQYERILYIDTDVIVREDCPNLFDVVPESKLGMFNEGVFVDRMPAMMSVVKQYGIELEKWERQYYNSGVMVVSRPHRYLFHKPANEISNFYEQSYLNLQIIKTKAPMHDLAYNFNRMSCMDKFLGEHRLCSHIVHYAGFPMGQEALIDLMTKDIDKWKTATPNYKSQEWARRNILIKVHGGLGDEICAEPVIRHIINKAYPGANIVIETWFPRLFSHLQARVCDINKFQPEIDKAYYLMETLVSPNNFAWHFVSANLSHNTDFASLMCLRKILPDDEKQVRLQVKMEDVAEASEALGDMTGRATLKEYVLVHPGRGWPSKTFPKKWWDEAISCILAKGLKVAIIGKHISNEQGTVDVDVPDGVVDLRNLLSLGGMMAVISQARVLLSNDSAPIHIAGAFDNWIILVPTCKHPDHVLPMRNGDRYHKAMSICQKLVCEAIDSTPTQVHGQTIDYVVGDILDYLPEPGFLAERVRECWDADEDSPVLA